MLQQHKCFPPCPQQMQIGRQGRHGLRRIAQCRIHGKTAHPGPGVTHSGQRVQQLGQAGAAAHGVFQPVVQPLGNAPHCGKRFWSCTGRPQQSQLTPARSGIVGIHSVDFRFFIQLQCFFRHIRSQRIRALLCPEGAQRAGTGKLCVAAFGKGLPVARPHAGQRHRGHGCLLFQNGLAVFHCQIVVGLIQQRGQCRARAERFHRCLPRSGKAAGTGCKLALQLGTVGCAAQHPGSFHQQGCVRRLCPEHQRIAPGGGKDAHPRPGKSLCPRAGTGRRQRKYQICPALQGGLHPHRFRQQRQCAALGQPAAHGHRHMLCSQRFCLRQLPCMAVVKGVVLCNDTGKFHR